MEQTPSPAHDPLVSLRTYRKLRAERTSKCNGGLLLQAGPDVYCDACGVYFCDRAEAECHGARRKDILIEFAERVLEVLQDGECDDLKKLHLIHGRALNTALLQD